ncbi:MAG: hypothetical protein EOS26_05410 [Mesorhizobium sp.]|nr:MAG: hypothetical protein EOS26_05410 [Mesorhizobium sp.]
MAPVHIMVSSGKRPMPGVMLEVDTEDKALAAEPDGYLHVMWPKVDELRMPTAPVWLACLFRTGVAA